MIMIAEGGWQKFRGVSQVAVIRPGNRISAEPLYYVDYGEKNGNAADEIDKLFETGAVRVRWIGK